jgi:hypothetical protein
MAKTSLDVENILYSEVKNSLLITGPKKITGGLYKSKRPINSTKEDVVINSLPLNRKQLQEGLLNMNVYVPNLEVTQGGVIDKSLPDTARLTELAAIASLVVGDINAADGDYSFILQQDNVFEDTNNQHYINLRIEFTSINI